MTSSWHHQVYFFKLWKASPQRCPTRDYAAVFRVVLLTTSKLNFMFQNLWSDPLTFLEFSRFTVNTVRTQSMPQNIKQLSSTRAQFLDIIIVKLLKMMDVSPRTKKGAPITNFIWNNIWNNQSIGNFNSMFSSILWRLLCMPSSWTDPWVKLLSVRTLTSC